MSLPAMALAAAAAVVLLAATADGYPSLLHARRAARSAASPSRTPTYYPDAVPSAYLYPDDYDEDLDYGQEQWFDAAAVDPAANAAFLQNLMEANKYTDRLDRLGLQAVPAPYERPGAPAARYLDPRYRDSDDYVFGSVNPGTSSGRGYDSAAAPAAPAAPYGRYQYRVDQQDEDDDADVRELHALAKKSRTEEERLQDLETQAILAAALSRQRERELRGLQELQDLQDLKDLEESQRAEEFAANNGADLADLDQGLERLFAKSGIANKYRNGDEPKPWNGRDPVWNGYYMGAVGDAVPRRPTRSRAASTAAPAAPTKAPAPIAAPASAAPAKATTTTTTTPEPPVKRMLSSGQKNGQPEVALLRPAAARPVARLAPRSAPRPAPRQHQGGVDEIRTLLRVQDNMAAPSHHGDLLSLLPAISKRSAEAPKNIVSDEGSLVDELNALKRKA